MYWTTSCLEPRIEAISKEVFALARYFRDSFVFGVSSHYLFKFSNNDRYVGFQSQFDPLLRLLIPLFETRTKINHVYGEVSPWLFHKTLRTKPIILTIASEKGAPIPEFLLRCAAIVVQTEGMRRRLLSLGIDEQKVHIVYPGVDLEKFKPAGKSPSLKKPRILFATAPRSKAELEARGVPLLVNTAQHYPDISFHFLFRKWNSGYTSLVPTRALIEQLGLENVTLTNTVVDDMPSLYREHHFTVIPYTKTDGGKECPNSMIESLACGVPVLISEISPFSSFISKNSCGVVFSCTYQGLRKAVEKGVYNYNELRRAAREVASKHFCKNKVFAFYQNIYNSLS